MESLREHKRRRRVDHIARRTGTEKTRSQILRVDEQMSTVRTEESEASVTARYPWREFWVLLAAGVLGLVLVLPYQITLLPTPPIPLPVLIVAAIAQSTILLALAVGVGLAAARSVGLHAPFVEAWVYGGDVPGALRALQLPLAVALGVASSLVLVALELALFRPLIPELAALSARTPERWQGLLASFYGGIDEELLTRLFLVSCFAWLLSRVLRRSTALWVAIAVSAVLFGLGHLPAAAALLPLTPALVMREVILNGIPGAVFGWLFWRRGLEAAMVAHFSADLVLHVVIAG